MSEASLGCGSVLPHLQSAIPPRAIASPPAERRAKDIRINP